MTALQSLIPRLLAFADTLDDTGAISATTTLRLDSGRMAQAKVTITVRPPVVTAVDDVAATDYGEPVSIDVLKNDSAPPGVKLRVASLTPPDKGTATLNQDGTIRYAPPPGWWGTATLAYENEPVPAA